MKAKKNNTVTELDLLDAILLATQNGHLKWREGRQRENGTYYGEGVTTIVITEVCPLVAGAPSETLGVQAFEVEVPGLIFYSWSGSPGIEKIWEILSEGLPSCRHWRNQCVKRMAELIIELSTRPTKARRSKSSNQKN